jgi:hypothetical protein
MRESAGRRLTIAALARMSVPGGKSSERNVPMLGVAPGSPCCKWYIKMRATMRLPWAVPAQPIVSGADTAPRGATDVILEHCGPFD